MAKSVKADDQPNQSIEVEKELERLKWNLGRVDLLVNNAGVFIPKPFTDYTSDDFRRMNETNLADLLCVAACSSANAPSEIWTRRQHHRFNCESANRGTAGKSRKPD